MGWSEDSLHRWLLRQPAPRGLAGSRGHDAAVLAKLRGQPVVCVDQTVEGVHFRADAAPERVGHKAVARALSDLAATAAQPVGVWLALCAPAQREQRWLERVIRAVRNTARAHGAELFGGDLCAARGALQLSVTALGTFAGPGRAPGRDRARAGQVLVLTGAVGGSLLGRHLAFEPRLEEGRWLAARGASAMMDVSDGLAFDLYRLARSSGVRIDLDLEALPIHADARRRARTSARDALWHALHDGEDHELVATLDARALARVQREAPRHCPTLAVIGRVRAGRGLYLCDAGGRAHMWRRGSGEYEHGA